MSIVTGTGDDGRTTLFGGKRVPKHHPRLSAYGTVDEAQSAIGMVRSFLSKQEGGESSNDFAALDKLLKKIQEELYTVGADLATPDKKVKIRRVSKGMIKALHTECSDLEAGLPELKSFIIPSGTQAAATCFWARSVVRLAEREVSSLMEQGGQVNLILVYLNRLGDLLFLIGREINRISGIEDEIISAG